MLKVRKFLFIAVSISFFVGGIFALHRALDPDRVCLQWDGIHELMFGGERVYSCDSTGRLRRPRLTEPLREWVVRLNRLSRLTWLVDSHASIALKIDIENAHAFEQSGARMILGFRLAEKPGHLERAVLLAWINRNWPEHDEFTREVMADILTWAVVGDATWTDPLAEVEVSSVERLRYSLMPESGASYCVFPFRSDYDLKSCEQPNAAELNEHQSLRPLVSWSIWNFVRELPASTQIRFFRGLVGEHFAAAAENVEPKAQAWVQSKVGELLRRWRLQAESSRPELRRIYWREDLIEPVNFDLTVEVTDPLLTAKTLESLKQWMKITPHRRVLFVAEGQNRILPEDVRVDMKTENIQTRRYVIIACEWPKAKDVLRLKSRLLYAVRVCEENNLPSWRDIMTSQAGPSLSTWTAN